MLAAVLTKPNFINVVFVNVIVRVYSVHSPVNVHVCLWCVGGSANAVNGEVLWSAHSLTVVPPVKLDPLAFARKLNVYVPASNQPTFKRE